MFFPAIEPPYRWRDWAAHEDGITGDELIAFINNDEADRPDHTRGPGLFAYLRGLTSSGPADDRRDVIATVFRGVANRMLNGYLLRDVINKINSIHFTSSDEIHTLGHLYESLLREMRDAAGDAGEFYTPRAVVQFMVEVAQPAAGRDGARPRLRHRRLSGRVVRPSGGAGANRRGRSASCKRTASPAARPSRCPTCWRR